MSATYFVYILASRSRTLYTGVTNNLQRRIVEHRNGFVPGFTSRYRIFRLVHFEVFSDVRAAIAREKEIKGWRREKKIWLVERDNPTWEDLGRCLADGRQEEEADPSRLRRDSLRSSPGKVESATGFGMTVGSAWRKAGGERKKQIPPDCVGTPFGRHRAKWKARPGSG